jgi:hypothetical protein
MGWGYMLALVGLVETLSAPLVNQVLYAILQRVEVLLCGLVGMLSRGVRTVCRTLRMSLKCSTLYRSEWCVHVCHVLRQIR